MSTAIRGHPFINFLKQGYARTNFRKRSWWSFPVLNNSNDSYKGQNSLSSLLVPLPPNPLLLRLLSLHHPNEMGRSNSGRGLELLQLYRQSFFKRLRGQHRGLGSRRLNLPDSRQHRPFHRSPPIPHHRPNFRLLRGHLYSRQRLSQRAPFKTPHLQQFRLLRAAKMVSWYRLRGPWKHRGALINRPKQYPSLYLNWNSLRLIQLAWLL